MAVHIEKKGRRIEVRSAGPLKGMKTAIPGAYQTVSGNWTVPLSMETCKLLREKFGRELVIGKELKRWSQGVANNRNYMAQLAVAKDADLEHLHLIAPKLAEAMDARKYQRVGVRYIADNPGTLLADDPGLGKTLQAMGGILEADVPGPYLVVAPKTAADTVWRREINRFLPDNHRAVIMPDSREARARKLRLTRYTATTWVIVHPEMLLVQAWWICPECKKRSPEGTKQKTTLPCGHQRGRNTKTVITPSFPHIFTIDWGAVIVDESHESLIRRKGVPTQRRRGLDLLRDNMRADGIRLASSGTPFDSKPEQLWGTLNWLDPKQYPAYYRWAEMFWQKGGYTGHEIGEFRKDREKLLWDSLSAIALRRTKAEVAPDLPPKTYVGTPLDLSDESSPVGVWLEMDGKQRKAYEEMEKFSATELDSGRLESITALAELTRLKQLACSYGDIKITRNRRGELEEKYIPTLPSNKFTWTVDSLEEWGYPRDPLTKVVVVSFYTGILEAFREATERHFKTRPDRPLCTSITGRTPNKYRREIIDAFNRRDKNSPQVMFLNVKAGGTAITLDTADRMIFISETRSPDQQKQAEDRIHRISNPRNCLYYYLRSLGTVDVGTALINQEKAQATHRLLDGRRGVEYLRQVIDLSRR